MLHNYGQQAFELSFPLRSLLTSSRQGLCVAFVLAVGTVITVLFCLTGWPDHRGAGRTRNASKPTEQDEVDELVEDDSAAFLTRKVATLILVCGGAILMPVLRILPWQNGFPGSATFEAHRMRCGTPDCRRDESCQKTGMDANASLLIGAEHEGTMCCRDLMLRMLVEVGAFLDSHDIEWYVTFGTLLGGWRNKSVIPWTDDVDIVVPSEEGRVALRSWRGERYRFGHYGSTVDLRGCADYDGYTKKLPHHPSGTGAHMWVNDLTPWLPLISCQGDICDGRRSPQGNAVPARSSYWSDAWYSGRTAYYFMDVYPPTEITLQDCGAFDSNGRTPRSSNRVIIGGLSFPTHRNVEACLESWYGASWHTPTHVHESDYILLEVQESVPAKSDFLEK